MNDNRRGLEIIFFLIAIGLFALFGGSARLLYQWESLIERGWPRIVGTLMVSVFAAWLVGLSLWKYWADQPALLLMTTGCASWLGSELIDQFARWAMRTVLRRLNGNDKT